jgi:hypothetical protein
VARKITITLIFLLLVFSLSAKAIDPTKPLIPGAGKVTSKIIKKNVFKQPLTAIFTKNNKAMAMIEGKLYSVGDLYRDARITKIYKDKVLLSSKNGNTHLTLIPKIKK